MAEFAVQQIVDQLQTSHEGYLRLPAWQIPQPQIDILPLLEEAIAQNSDIRITYLAAGSGQRTIRRLTPYWLEIQYGTLYLNAWCHLREEERIFRLDRIEACEILE